MSARRGAVLVADVSIEKARLAVTTLDKVVVERREIEMRVDAGPLALLGAICDAFSDMLQSNSMTADDALAISVGLPSAR